MIIKLSPQFRTIELNVSRMGDRLTINGIEYDFGPLQDGSTLPAEAIDCEFIVGPVDRIEGKVYLTLLLPIQRTIFMEDLLDITDPSDGPINLPIIQGEPHVD